VGQQVLHTMDRTLALFADELRLAQVADIDLPPALSVTGLPPVPPRPWHNLGVWHHMGTTRMHDSAQLGVVDRNCKVHGINNLFVAGSSVFPTYGANFPTITIAALALRLADHLAVEMAS
jgi:choline dehydrogenase-like flavoprotein